MADGKEYISHEGELGSVSISEEVLAVIAAAAAVDVEGVSCLGSGLSSDVTATSTAAAAAMTASTSSEMLTLPSSLSWEIYSLPSAITPHAPFFRLEVLYHPGGQITIPIFPAPGFLTAPPQ